eukprot:Skav218571  [mRNA]  locus=scaffold2610:193804:197598:- [translate_table: standard]
MAENVATIRSHSHFELLLKVASWCGYKMIWETIADLKRVAPVSRKRWLAVFVPVSCDESMWKSFDFLQLPETSLSLFRTMIRLPEVHERELTLDTELIQMYSNPAFVAKGKFGTCKQLNPRKVLEQRIRNGSSTLSTIMAMYGAQHDLPPHVLSSKGMFTELWSGSFGVRFLSPAETAILHCTVIDFAFPLASRLGHSIVGNCIAVPHAVLAMAVAKNVTDPAFKEDPRETVIAALMQRLHSENARVTIRGNVVVLERLTTQAKDEEIVDDDMVENTEIDLSQTLSFCCEYQVKLILDHDGTHMYNIEPGTTLRQLLFNHDLSYLEDALSLDANGHVFPLDREIQCDMVLRMTWCEAVIDDTARHGGTWQICKAPFHEVTEISRRIEEALSRPVTCRDTMLNPVEPPPPDKQEAIVLFTTGDNPMFSRAGFQIPYDAPQDRFPSELARLLPTFRVAGDHVSIVANEPMTKSEVEGHCERIMNPLIGILAATKWEWHDGGEDTLQIGLLKPGQGAAPVMTIMNPICKSAVSVALAPSVHEEGLRVSIMLDGLGLWDGTLHPELVVAQLLGLVKAVLASCGRPLFVTSVDGMRVLEESQVTIGSLACTNGSVIFKLTSQSFGSTLHLWGGGGKVDVWKEAKHLLGQEMLQHGWSVAGLDDETTHWLRMIGQNKLFGVLRQQLTSEKRWTMLTELAKWHGLRCTPDDDTRTRAAQKIQKAMRKNLGTKLTAGQFTLCDGYFVDASGEPLQVLPHIALDASGVCLLDIESAMGWLTQKLPIISDELAVIALYNSNLPPQVPVPVEVTFPALDHKGRQVLLKGHMWQLGEKHARPGPREREVVTADTVTLAATIWRDSCSDAQWTSLSKSLVKFAFEQLFDEESRKMVLQVWGRSFRNDKTRTEPELAVSAQFHFRIPKDEVEHCLKLSGKSVVFLTPKSESHLSHPDWGLIWFKDFREAEIAAARATQHSGFARTRTRYALRVPISVLDQIAKEVKKEQGPHAIQVRFLYKVQPLPHDIKPEQVVEWAQGFEWKVKLIKKLGRDAVLLGSSDQVPFAHMSMNGKPVLVKEINAHKARPQVSPLIAGPRPPPLRSVNDASLDSLQENDPWAGFRETSVSESNEGDAMSSVPSTATRSVDAPTAAKFLAIEQRLTAFENNLTNLSKTSACQTAAIETTNEVVTGMKAHLHQVDHAVQSLGQQMAGALEVAVAKGLESQEKKMDTKFEQLMGMLKSRTNKRAVPGPEVIPLTDDGEDHEMESPVKPPVAKK